VTDADAPVRSERLELPLLSLDQLDRLAAADPSPVAAQLNATLAPAWVAEVRRLSSLRAEQARRRPRDRTWLLRPILLRGVDGAPADAIGYVNFHAAPHADGRVEIGYALLPAYRGHGYALEAVRAMFDWARQHPGVRRFRASVAPGNERSLNLITKLGFERVGEQWDEEDGLEYVYEVDA